MLDLIIQTFWFLLPAGIANMSPVLFKKVPFLNFSVDLGAKLGGRPLFGSHKTYRGFFFGTLMAVLTVWLQKFFYPQLINISLIDYSVINVFLLGFLLGFGALLGDLVKSFFKRRLNIRSGQPWIIFDQLDWIIGSLMLAGFYVSISWESALVSVIIFGLLHPLVNLLGYFLHFKENKF